MKQRPNSKQFTITGKPKDDVERLYKSKHLADSNYSYTDLMCELLEHYPDPEERIHDAFKKITTVFREAGFKGDDINSVQQIETLLLYLLEEDFKERVQYGVNQTIQNISSGGKLK